MAKLYASEAAQQVSTDGLRLHGARGQLAAFSAERHYRDTPLIIVSTESSETDKARGMALGAAEYLVKPFEPETLTSLVRRYVKIG